MRLGEYSIEWGGGDAWYGDEFSRLESLVRASTHPTWLAPQGRWNSHGQPLLRSGKVQRTIYPSPPEPDRSQFVMLLILVASRGTGKGDEEMERYREQLARTYRYYERLKKLNEGRATEPSSELNMDDIYAFFQNCYHLKDWLKNDPAYTLHSGKEIEDYVSKSTELCICADICNGSKHLTFNRPPRSGAKPKFGRKIESTGEIIASGKVVDRSFAMFVEVEHPCGRIDAFQLATAALKSWESFIEQAGVKAEE